LSISFPTTSLPHANHESLWAGDFKIIETSHFKVISCLCCEANILSLDMYSLSIRGSDKELLDAI
jgi:hypothetical protein